MVKFVRRERKHKRLAKQLPSQDANTEIILPRSQAEKEARKAAIAAELRNEQSATKTTTSKKRKRLDKYIDTKLRKEENAGLLKRLALQKVDTSLFQSAKKLGRVRETKRERLSRFLAQHKAGIDVNGDHEEVLFEPRRQTETQSDASESDLQTSDGEEVEITVSANDLRAEFAQSLGSGLKRPLETDDDGQPVIKRRKREKRPKLDLSADPLDGSPAQSDGGRISHTSTTDDDQEREWSGFESDSALSLRTEYSDDDHPMSSASVGDETSESGMSYELCTPSATSDKQGRVSAFKTWADMQRNAALDFTPSTAINRDTQIMSNFTPRAPSPDPISSMATHTSRAKISKPTAAISIARNEDIQSSRLELPAVQEEQKIMEAIHGNPIVLVCGATGSGKTTQVPQMMFESGYGSRISCMCQDSSSMSNPQSKGMIGVTQPRRIAAMSVAERVATELGREYRQCVAHQVRYDSTVSRGTAIKFMTDGILLREINQDFVLSRYSAIVLDEAHERSVNTDILIGMVSRIVSLREELAKEEPEKHYPLKLIIMSATLKVSDFTQNERLFRIGLPPIVQVEGRQYPVTMHFSRKTQRDYVSEMVNKVARGHRKLPQGGFLVFLTAQNETQTVAKQLSERLGSGTASHSQMRHLASNDDYEDSDTGQYGIDFLEGEEREFSDDDDLVVHGLDDTNDREFDVETDEHSDHRGILRPHILPLYAALPSAQQLRVFQTPPAGSRLIVLATNVAETSLTIPGVRYVFDCGRSKEKRYNTSTGVQTYEVDWISKASAAQRQGRAGRTGPGHCYGLYSSAVYEQYFAEHAVPEILRTPLESTVLQLKSMSIENVANFPFPTAPDRVQLIAAEKLLIILGTINERTGKITDTGKELIHFPVSPRFGKMLLLGVKHSVLVHIVALVAGLAVGDLFVPEAQLGLETALHGIETTAGDDDSGDSGENYALRQAEEVLQTQSQQRKQARNRAHAMLSRWDNHSDAIKLLTAVAAYVEASGSGKPSSAASKFCEDFFLRVRAMSEVQQLRGQLHSIVSAQRASCHIGADTGLDESLPLPSEKEISVLKQIVAVGFVDQVAIRADLLKEEPAFNRKPRRAIEVAYRTLVPTDDGDIDCTLSGDQLELRRSVFVHPSSVLARLSAKEMPSYIIYSHLSRPAPAIVGTDRQARTRMHPLTTVGPKVLAALAEGTPLLEIGKPIGKIEDLQRSADGWSRRQCWVSISIRPPGSSNSGWQLATWKVIQVRKKDWEIERVLFR